MYAVSVCILNSSSPNSSSPDAPHYVLNVKRLVSTNAYSPHPYVSMIEYARLPAYRAPSIITNVYFWMPFTLIPRQSSLSVLPKCGINKTFDSLSYILSTHRVSLSRGHSKTIFGDPNECVMYKCFGVRPGRNSTGVLDCDRWAERIDTIHWRHVMKMVMRVELLFEMFADQEVIDHVCAAKDVVPFKTMHAPHRHRTCAHIPHAKYFGAIAFGCNAPAPYMSTHSSCKIFWCHCIWLQCVSSLSHRRRLHLEHCSCSFGR